MAIIPVLTAIKIEQGYAASTILTPKWTRSGIGSNWEGGLVIGDVTGDGLEDVVYAGGGSDRIYVLNGETGATIATYTNTRINPYCQPQLYDVDGDDVLDIIVPLYYVPGLAAVKYDGTTTLLQLWIVNTQGSSGSGTVMAKPVAGDIDNDGHIDIFIASQDVAPNGGYDGTVCRIDYRGNIVAQNFAWRACSGGLSLADTDNDGVFEIYQGDRQMGYSDGGYGKGAKSLWADNLTERWNRLDFLSSSQAPALVDVNGDGVLDVVTGMYREMNVLQSSTGEWIRRVSSSVMSVHYGITVYDVDEDGHVELLCSDGDHDDDAYADVFDLVTGQLKAELPLAGGDWKWSPLVADIDPSSPGMEIIVCPNGTTVDNPDQSYSQGAIFIFSNKYQSLQNITRDSSGNRLSSQLAFPIVQDIDGDSLLELVTHSSTGTVYAFDTSAPAPGYSSALPGSHRIRSEVTFYGEERTGAAVYQPEPWAPDYWTSPLIAPISPGDNTVAVPRSTTQLEFQLRDHQSRALTYSVTTSPNIGSRSGTLHSNTYSWNAITVDVGSLAYDTTYSWTVTASDGIQVTTRTYNFRTEMAPSTDNNPPTQSKPTITPLDGVGITTSTFECTAQSTSDADNDEVTNIYRWTVNGVPAAQLLLPFDTRDENSTADYSGFGNNGVIMGATWVPTGVVGGAYSFDGKDDGIVVSDGGVGYFNDRNYTSNSEEIGGFGDWDAVTVEAWVYLRENNDGSRIVAKVPSYALGFQSGYTNRLYGSVWPMTGEISNDDNAASRDRERSVSANTNMQLNRWYHIAFSYESGVGLKLYLDGQLIAQSSAYTGNVKISRGEPLYIGRLVQPFAGIIDDVRLYSYAVPAEQIYNRYIESKDGDSSSSLFTPAGFSALGDTLICDVIPTDSYTEGNVLSASRILQDTPSVTYQLQVQVQGSGATTPSGTIIYNEGTDVAVQALPEAGWQFTHWMLDGSNVGSANPYTVTMNANHVCVAVFTETPTSGLVQGTVKDADTGRPMSADIYVNGTYEASTNATGQYSLELSAGDYEIKAEDAEGSVYDSQTVAVTITAGVITTQDFQLERISWVISVDTSGSGDTDPLPGAYTWPKDTEFPVEALPDPGFRLLYWLLDSVDVGTENPLPVLMNANHDLTAVFAEEAPTGLRGTVTDSDTSLPVEGAEVIVDGRSVFTDAAGNYETQLLAGHYTITVNEEFYYSQARSVEVNYDSNNVQNFILERSHWILTVEIEGSGSTNLTQGFHPFPLGSDIAVEASTDEGWTFSHWLLDTVDAGSDSTISVPMNSDHILRAVFVETPLPSPSPSPSPTSQPTPTPNPTSTLSPSSSQEPIPSPSESPDATPPPSETPWSSPPPDLGVILGLSGTVIVVVIVMVVVFILLKKK